MIGSDKLAVITGGASGIGRALAEQLAAEGARVVIADRDVTGAEAVAAELRARGATASARRVDVADPEQIDALVDGVEAEVGPISLMINNAGIALSGEAHALSRGDWDRILAVNLGGVVHGTRAAYQKMIPRGAGQILNVASMAGLAPMPLVAAYSATKHGVVALSQAMRVEAAPLGIRINVACPGAIATPIHQSGESRGLTPQAVAAAMLGDRPMMSAEACARAILKGAARDQAVIIAPASARIVWYLQRFAPWLWARATASWVSTARQLSPQATREAQLSPLNPGGLS